MKFSVIVPVYNVADYLSACVVSLLSQRCDDWELILVDDGSTDGICPVLCDELAAAHPELIRTIHQENGGLGAARNTGLEAAKGDYLLFVDSDDTLEPQTLERLNEEVEKTHADMYVFHYRYITDNGEQPGEARQSAVTGEPVSLETEPALLLDSPSACFRLWKRELFADGSIRFPGRVWYEDLCTTPKALLRAKSIVQIPDSFYRYLLRPGSIMRNDQLRRNLEILNALETVRVYYEQAGALERFRPWLCYLAVDSVLGAARRVLTVDPKADFLPDFLNYVKEKYPDYRRNELLPRLGKKKLILLKLLEGKRYMAAKLLFDFVNKLK
ncbi:MAG: glycosyltransferase [Oscillospiraceae bacterium]|nr:glycosyltransferase [Oscillospiraceae bacterium]